MLMNVPHISSACRRTVLAQVRGRHSPQWHTKAFTSLSNLRTSTDSNLKHVHNLLDIADSQKDAAIKIPRSRQPGKPKKDAGDILESIFQDALKHDQPSASSATSVQHAPSVDMYRHLETVQEMMKNPLIPRAELWKYFVEHFGKEAADGEGLQITRPVAFPGVTRTLFDIIRHTIKDAWVDARELESFPTMTEVVKTYSELGLLSHKDWNQVIWDVLVELTRRKTSKGLGGSLDSDEQVFADLLGVWKLFCSAYRPYRAQDVPANVLDADWTTLPKSLQTDVFHGRSKMALNVVSQTLFPAYSAMTLRQPLACAIILTYGLLSHPSKIESASAKMARPFLNAIGSVIGRDWATQPEVRDVIMRYVRISDEKDRDTLWKSLSESVYQSDTPKEMRPQLTDARPELPVVFLRRLGMAAKHREVQRIDALFAETIESGASRKESPAINIELHHRFIYSYMIARQPERAIDVWNHMIQTGLTPTIQTWTAMLEGCRIGQDVQSLENVWAKLQASGMQPDVVCWTTMIAGLIENGRGYGKQSDNMVKGVRLLEEMGRVWLEGEKKAAQSRNKVNNAVKPTVYTMNVVMAALMKREHHDIIARLVQWGKQFGIKNDIVTYNTLLRWYIRGGRTNDAQQLLQDMQDDGVQADGVTFTTILDETFRGSSSLTQQERNDVVNNVFTEMKKAGVEANHYTYGKIIYILLQDARNTGDISTVQQVLDRMASQGLKQNEYTLTSLVDFYFTQKPPDLAAVDVAIKEMGKANHFNEVIFWDRVIQGYSSIGDSITALKYFGRHNRVGAKVGWLALGSLLQALVKNGQYDLAVQFVRDVGNDRRPPPGEDERGQEGEHRFWSMAREFQSSS